MAASSPPSARDLLADAVGVALPLVTRVRGIETREAMLLRGPNGWAEFAPFVEYGDEEAATWLAAAVDFGWGDEPELRRDRIPVNATVPAVAPVEVPGVLARFPGIRTAKVKVAERGQTLADDVDRVREVRRALGPEGRIRVDANGAWNLDEAEHAAHELSPFDLEYREQPCGTLDALAELRRRLHDWQLQIAADESVRKADDPIAVVRAEAADILVVKAAPLGGIAAALRIVERSGLPAVVSSALDTSIGIAQGARLAAALPDLEFDCGLGTASLLAADVTLAPRLPVDGAIGVDRVEPDAGLLERWTASAERTAWWRDRLQRCQELLASRP